MNSLDRKKYPRLVIAGTQSGVGKTTITLGLLGALKKRKIAVQPFKIGPDYIDTAYHTRVAGRICRNLDSYLLNKHAVCELFERQAKDADFSLIEGVMGLYDGVGVDGTRCSSADVAGILKAPVILVIDAQRMAQSVAAQVLGYKKYSNKITIAGCIINKIKSKRHYAIIKQALEVKTKIPVLGYIPKEKDIEIPQRHLGLRAVQEADMKFFNRKVANTIEKHIDIDTLLRIGRGAPSVPEFKKNIFVLPLSRPHLRIAVAHDSCFHFYYQDNLDILKHLGAALTNFSPLKDKTLPKDLDGIYIGGGFPELFAKELSANASMLAGLREKSNKGMPIYAECGGLMYLMKEIKLKDRAAYPMAGVFPGSVRMGRSLQSFGYHRIRSLSDTIISKKSSSLRGHMFHWSYLTNMPKRYEPAFSLSRKNEVIYDGYVKNNTLASYVHIHFGTDISWAKKFIRSCGEYKEKRG